MKYSLILGAILASMFTHSGVFAQDGLFSIEDPKSNMYLTGELDVSVKSSPLVSTGMLECSLRKPVPARKILFFTGILMPQGTSSMTFQIERNTSSYTKGKYILSCFLYSLENNQLLGTDQVKFRYLPPPPVVRFAQEKGNLIKNPEFSELQGELPAFWRYGSYGRNDLTQDHPFQGLVGKKSLRSSIYNYISGDAKWYFDDVPALPGRTYIYAQKYHSTIPAKIIVRYTMKDGTFQYDVLRYLESTSTPYESVRVYFIAPKDVVSFTVWTSIDSIGSLVIDDPLLLLSPTEETP